MLQRSLIRNSWRSCLFAVICSMDMIIPSSQTGTDLERAKTISGAVNFIIGSRKRRRKETLL